METGFQLEDFLALMKRLLLSFRHLTWSLEQLENLIDWWSDMEPLLKLAEQLENLIVVADLEPLLKVAVPHLIDKLDDLEQKGIFRINKAMLNMYGKIAENIQPRISTPSATALSACTVSSKNCPSRP